MKGGVVLSSFPIGVGSGFVSPLLIPFTHFASPYLSSLLPLLEGRIEAGWCYFVLKSATIFLPRRYSSGQRGQTVNLLAIGLRRFESCPAHKLSEARF